MTHPADSLLEASASATKFRRVEITVIIDGDPFAPKYTTVYAHHALTTERINELAFELFGKKNTTVTEIITSRRT